MNMLKFIRKAGTFFMMVGTAFFLSACFDPYNQFATLAVGIAIYCLVLGIYLYESSLKRIVKW